MTDTRTIRPGLTLELEAADSWERMEAERGRPLDVNRSLADRDTQMKLYEDYRTGRSKTLALHPDKSWHCPPRVRAVDTDDDAWVRAHPDHGWRFVVASEKWHAQYYPELDKHRGAGRPATATPATPFSPQIESETTMLTLHRESNNAAYVIVPFESIKHVPNKREEQLVTYVDPTAKFPGLNDGDLGLVMWNLGFPDLGRDVNRLPLNGETYTVPGR